MNRNPVVNATTMIPFTDTISLIRREPDGCQFRDQHTAIPPFSEASEPILQRPRNVEERIQTTSENRRVHQYHGCDKAAARLAANTLFLRRYDEICSQKCCDAPLASNSTKPMFFESE